jgi:hypothetical protein
MTTTKRTPQEWATWWEEFRKRHGLDKALPLPPEDAPLPPPPHSDTDREPGEEG